MLNKIKNVGIEMNNNIIASNGIFSTQEKFEFDADSFIQRLLLFDNFILESVRLKEIPFLIDLMGHDGVMQLLEADFFQIRCEARTIGQVGQLYLRKDWGQNILALEEYSFKIISSVNNEYLSSCFKEIEPLLKITPKEFIKLKGAISNNIIGAPKGFGAKTMDDAHNTIINSAYIIKPLIEQRIKEEYNINIDKSKIKLNIESLNEHDILVKTNLHKDFNQLFNKETSHSFVTNVLLSLIGTNLRLEKMETFNAKTYFNDKDIFCIKSKMNYLIEQFNSSTQQDRLVRVLDIKEHPRLNINPNIKIDIQVLLKIRDTKNCKDFRVWLNNIDALSNADVEEYLKGYTDLIKDFGHSIFGKTLRLLTSSGADLILPGSGFALNAADTFLFSKVIPKKGSVLFLKNDYPRIFKVQ